MEIRHDGPAGDAVTDALAPIGDLATGERAEIALRDGAVMLLGARSASSGVEAFPARAICPETVARDMAPAEFGPDAVLYAFSTVHVSASREVPYTLGYVDFPSGLRALAHVRGEGLRCDMPVTLRADEGGWWVEPAADAS